MARLMSVTLTEQAVVERRKTVTRRLGWKNLKVGDELDLCRKVMGRRRRDGSVDPLVRLARVRVIDVRRERINEIEDDDVAREGLTYEDLRDFDKQWDFCECPEPNPDCDWGCGEPDSGRLGTAFLHFFLHHMKVPSGTEVTRIEWEYIDEGATAA